MSEIIKLKKGLNIKLKGSAEKILSPETPAGRYAVKPSDFPGLIPKLSVQPGDTVKAGSALFFDKFRPEVKFTSPVSGKVTDVVRGERRRILEVTIEEQGRDYVDFGIARPDSLSAEEITLRLLDSGLWPVIRQRDRKSVV